MELCRAAMLCNEAEFHLMNDQLELHGDPTEGALIILGIDALPVCIDRCKTSCKIGRLAKNKEL